MIHPALALLLSIQTQDSTSLALRRRVWDGLSALERMEQHLTTRRAIPKDGSTTRLLEEVRGSLDTMVFGTTWGGAELTQLRLAFPGSALLARYAARLDERTGQSGLALTEVDRLLARDPADADLQQMRGRLLETLNRPADALDAYARAFDLAPENDSTFHLIQRLSERLGTLPVLLDQIRRLRIRLPSSRSLVDHEVEVSQRLGVTR